MAAFDFELPPNAPASLRLLLSCIAARFAERHVRELIEKAGFLFPTEQYESDARDMDEMAITQYTNTFESASKVGVGWV
jgi:hypothetical protein